VALEHAANGTALARAHANDHALRRPRAAGNRLA
jgi:hypothetical protein